MKMTIIEGHPDPSSERLCWALASTYADAAVAAGSEVRRIIVGELDFPFIRNSEDFQKSTPPPAIRAAQEAILWADHIVIVFPMWLSDVPARLKAFLEQTLRPNFVLAEASRFRKPLLKGRSARLIVTMGMPSFVYRVMFGAHMIGLLRRMLAMTGIGPTEATLIGSVEAAPERARGKWFAEIERLAQRDGMRGSRHAAIVRRIATIGVLGAVGLGAGAAYLAYSRTR